jgi:hypothetical protein
MKHKADVILEIGKKVYKPSGKPFKSGEKVNTIKGITINPHTDEPAYTFLEDESIVDARSVEEFIQ